MEEVIAAADGTSWFQLYFRGGRNGAEALVYRAQRAGFSALFVTLDVSGGIPIERTLRDGSRLVTLRGDQAKDAALPSTLSLRNAVRFAPQLARHLHWTADYVRDGVPRRFAQQDDAEMTKVMQVSGPVIDDRPKPMWSGRPVGGSVNTLTIPTWDDLVWIREAWKGKLVAKGLVRGDDARRAVDLGVDGILVSNHGGRQLDTGIATLRALPEIRAAVGDGLPLLIDGGIRRGGDIVKAIALGANCAVMGRPYGYGLAAAGEAGVRRILEIFQLELLQTMRALGLSSLKEIDESSIDTSRFFLAQRIASQEAMR
jgi:L-lactate dehydrogenase (cytochrome)